MENNELKKVPIKNCPCYYFDDIIKLQDFNLDNILIHEKSYGSIWIYDISYKMSDWFSKIDGIIIIMMEVDMTLFTTELGIF